MELNRIYNEDCLEGMKRIPDGSVDMILCDLPYGTVKGMKLDGWENDSAYWDNIIDNSLLFEEYNRVLKESGSAILFSQEPFTSELRTFKHNNVVFAYPLIWVKDHFANPFNASRAPVSYFEDISVFRKKYDTQNLNPLRSYFKSVLSHAGLTSSKEVNALLGHRKAEHSFYITSTQFKLCTRKTYLELEENLRLRDMNGYKSFEELESMNEKYKPTFNIQGKSEYASNILNFKKDYGALHPTQKPVELFKYLIRTYTNEGETVLDNCMGSGTTAIACMDTNRNYIGFELDETYHKKSLERIKNHATQTELFDFI